MRSPTSRWLFWLGMVATPLGAATVHAQPTPRDHRDERRPAPPPEPRDHRDAHDDGPREAPPAPRAETPGTRAGYVWVTGRWSWSNGKYEWTAGHWERERAGKRWREGRWEQRADHWVYSDGGWDDGTATTSPPPPPAPPPGGPHEAPPPPRAETPGTRAGYVWAAGEWTWTNGAYAWVPGHWERERAGKHWRPGRWEARGGSWARVEGGWDDGAGDRDRDRDRDGDRDRDHRGHREWKLDRPVVASYWPVKGKAGTRVVIRGRNFPTSAQVVFAGTPVPGAKVTPDRIVFVLPANAASGTIELAIGRARPLPVGSFEVAASFDAAAEQQRLDAERRAKAEAAWAARRSKLANDRAARLAAMTQHQQELATTREQRRAARIAELQAQFDRAFLADEETQAELTLHAQRTAELARMREVAALTADTRIGVRIELAQQREEDRHIERMTSLKAAFAAGGSR